MNRDNKYRAYLYVRGIPKYKHILRLDKLPYGEYDSDTIVDDKTIAKAMKFVDGLHYRDVDSIELVMFKIINNNLVDLTDRLSFRMWSKE